MKPSKGYYAIVQYCPDPSRLEAANVGVLLYCHARGFCEVKMSHNNLRVRRFFGHCSADLLFCVDSAKQAIIDRVKIESPAWLECCKRDGRQWLERYIRLRANEIIITAPRSMRVVDPQEELERLYRDLVMDPERKSK